MTGDLRGHIAELRDFLCNASEFAIVNDDKLACQLAHETLDSIVILLAGLAPQQAQLALPPAEVSHG